MSDETNGNSLPAAREAVIEQAHRIHQEVAHERDQLRLRIIDLQTEISGLKAQLQVAELESSQLRSRTENIMSDRDEAISDRAVYETLFISVQAQFRAFRIPAAPLVRDRSEEEMDGYEDNLSRESALPNSHMEPR